MARKRTPVSPDQLSLDLGPAPPAPVATPVAPVVTSGGSARVERGRQHKPPRPPTSRGPGVWHPGRIGAEYPFYGDRWVLHHVGVGGKLVLHSTTRSCVALEMPTRRFLDRTKRLCSPRVPVTPGGAYQVPCMGCRLPVDVGGPHGLGIRCGDCDRLTPVVDEDDEFDVF